jgi:hypothetical protein
VFTQPVRVSINNYLTKQIELRIKVNIFYATIILFLKKIMLFNDCTSFI